MFHIFHFCFYFNFRNQIIFTNPCKLVVFVWPDVTIREEHPIVTTDISCHPSLSVLTPGKYYTCKFNQGLVNNGCVNILLILRPYTEGEPGGLTRQLPRKSDTAGARTASVLVKFARAKTLRLQHVGRLTAIHRNLWETENSSQTGEWFTCSVLVKMNWGRTGFDWWRPTTKT